MPYIQQLAPLYRDADEDGKIGLRGYLRYSQDVIASWLISHGKGTTQFLKRIMLDGSLFVHVYMNKKADYSAPICASLWLEPYAQPVIANVLIRFKQNGSILAEARFELCVMNLSRRRVVRFSLSSSRKALRKLSHPVSLYLRTSMFQTKHLSINTTEQLDTQILILIDT